MKKYPRLITADINEDMGPFFTCSAGRNGLL